MNIKIKTRGMHCASCEMLVKDALKELDGVNRVNVSFKSGIVEIDFDDSKVDENKLKKVIKAEGYDIL